MPFYVIILNVNGGESSEALFEANNDSHAATEYPKNIPGTLNGVQHQLSYRRCEFDALEHQPRMARPQLGTSSYINMPGSGPLYVMAENAQPQLPHDNNSLASSLNQLALLVASIRDIFYSIEPHQNNINVYGHLIRNTLLLAAIEFENECKGVLSANEYTPVGNTNRWTTGDFVKVLHPLRLLEYEVQLGYYPAIIPRLPFAGWNSQAPTQSLLWYDAYNAVKHDREANFARATVEHAIDAVTACAIMLAAQYRIIPNWKEQIGGFFVFRKHPDWPIEQRYVNSTRPGRPRQWSDRPFSFP